MFTKPNKGKGEKRQRFTLIEEASGQAPTPPPRRYLSYLPGLQACKELWFEKVFSKSKMVMSM